MTLKFQDFSLTTVNSRPWLNISNKPREEDDVFEALDSIMLGQASPDFRFEFGLYFWTRNCDFYFNHKNCSGFIGFSGSHQQIDNAILTQVVETQGAVIMPCAGPLHTAYQCSSTGELMRGLEKRVTSIHVNENLEFDSFSFSSVVFFKMSEPE